MKIVIAIMFCLIAQVASAEQVIKIWSRASGSDFNAFHQDMAGKLYDPAGNTTVYSTAQLGLFAFAYAKTKGYLDLVPASNREPASYAAVFLAHNGYRNIKAITTTEFQRRGQGMGWRLPVYPSLQQPASALANGPSYEAAMATALKTFQSESQKSMGEFEARVGAEFQRQAGEIATLRSELTTTSEQAEAAKQAADAAVVEAMTATKIAQAVEVEVASLTTTVSDLSTMVKAVAENAMIAESTAQAAQTQVTALQGSVEDAQGQITKLQDSAAGSQTQISTLQKTVDWMKNVVVLLVLALIAGAMHLVVKAAKSSLARFFKKTPKSNQSADSTSSKMGGAPTFAKAA